MRDVRSIPCGELAMSAKGHKRTFKSSILAKEKPPGHCPGF